MHNYPEHVIFLFCHKLDFENFLKKSEHFSSSKIKMIGADTLNVGKELTTKCYKPSGWNPYFSSQQTPSFLLRQNSPYCYPHPPHSPYFRYWIQGAAQVYQRNFYLDTYQPLWMPFLARGPLLRTFYLFWNLGSLYNT